MDRRIVEKISEMINNTSYLVRNTACFLIKNFAEKGSEREYMEFFEGNLVDFLVSLVKDKISNVRLVAGVSVMKAKKFIKDKSCAEKINKCLDILKADKDADVQKEMRKVL